MDEKYLRIALELAKKGAGFVSPNPMVGCVIVKNDKIIGRGYHCCFGEPHAEINAIRSVRSPLLLKGSTMYVNLEPCSHTNKKTPPCVPEIIKAGIKKVTLSMKDPNPQVNGRGISQLKSAGIRCQAGLLEKEARELNMSYIKWITKNTPYVISKWAMSIDGKIATKTGDSRWISSDEARKYTHKLRGEVDAVMVGIGTVLKDNPTLTSRIDDRQGRGCMGHQPLRVLLDPDLKVPLNANIINKDAGTIIFYKRGLLDKKYKSKLDVLYNNNVVTIKSKLKKGGFNLNEIMDFLAKNGISSVLIEGGGETHASALKSGIVDEINVFLAPKIVGGWDAKTPVEGLGITKLSEAIKIKKIEVQRIGPDLLIKGYL